MKKVIAILLAVLVAGSAIALGIKYKNDAKERRETAALSEQVTRLNTKKIKITRQIDDAWKKYEIAERGGDSCLVLFYDNMTPNLMEEIFPRVSSENYDFVGVVTLSDLKMPGDEGCITWDDYATLVDAGWDFAIGTGTLNLSGANSVDVLKVYLEQYKAICEENEIEFPITFCFNPDQYDAKYNSLLNEYGFKVVRHFGENYDLLTSSIEFDGLYMLGCSVMHQADTTLKADLKEVKEMQLPFSVSVRYITRDPEDDKQDCKPARYLDMLTYIKNVNVLNGQEFYEYKLKTLTEAAEYLENFSTIIADLEESLEEVKADIEKITK